MPKKITTRERCADCGWVCDAGEYHPHSFCVLVKAGYDPWQTIRIIAGQVGLPDPGQKPPKVTELHA
jgi:hypothetical protein